MSGRTHSFDEAIDDEESNDQIQVICRRPNPAPRAGADDKYIEIELAKPSRAFYFGDRVVYEQEARSGSIRKRRNESWTG